MGNLESGKGGKLVPDPPEGMTRAQVLEVNCLIDKSKMVIELRGNMAMKKLANQ